MTGIARTRTTDLLALDVFNPRTGAREGVLVLVDGAVDQTDESGTTSPAVALTYLPGLTVDHLLVDDDRAEVLRVADGLRNTERVTDERLPLDAVARADWQSWRDWQDRTIAAVLAERWGEARELLQHRLVADRKTGPLERARELVGERYRRQHRESLPICPACDEPVEDGIDVAEDGADGRREMVHYHPACLGDAETPEA